MSSEIDQNLLKSILLKLLDKAGTDPRLTPRLLRNKVEDKMKLERGKLKFKREYIKTIIMRWWKANNQPTDKVNSSSEKDEEAEWKALVALARASGKWLSLCKKLDTTNNSEKNKSLRKKLREAGLKFSDFPTEAEINKAKKDFELKSELSGISKDSILSPSKKRQVEDVSKAADAKAQKVERVHGGETRKRVEYNSSDEEGDF